MRKGPPNKNQLRLVAWEVTRRCNLNCVHCRAASERGPYTGELDTDQCREILDQIALIGKPIIILTGGEPLLRKDIFDLALHGTNVGLRMVMATNGTIVTPENVEKIKSYVDNLNLLYVTFTRASHALYCLSDIGSKAGSKISTVSDLLFDIFSDNYKKQELSKDDILIPRSDKEGNIIGCYHVPLRQSWFRPSSRDRLFADLS